MWVSLAITRGAMERPARYRCVDCAIPAAQYDHRDYSKPLDVAPVCRSCNRKRGSAKAKRYTGTQVVKRIRALESFPIASHLKPYFLRWAALPDTIPRAWIAALKGMK